MNVGHPAPAGATCVAYGCESRAVAMDLALAPRRDYVICYGEDAGREHEWRGSYLELKPVCDNHRSGAPDGYELTSSDPRAN